MNLESIRSAAENARDSAQTLREAERTLDETIAQARREGATIETLMEAAGRSRQGIYNALRRTK